MLKNSDPISFIATIDASTSRVFYEEVLGFELVADEYFGLEFDLNGHVLRIAKVDNLLPAVHTVLGWHVDSIKQTVKELVARGVSFEMFSGMQQDKFGIWVSPSEAKVAWFKDPDGNTLSITQLESGSAA